MSAVFTIGQAPARAWLLMPQVVGGVVVESTSILCLAAEYTVLYASGATSDVLPALTPAAVFGGGTVFDPTTQVWLPYCVQGSNTLSVIAENDLASLTGTYAILGRLTRLSVYQYQQS